MDADTVGSVREALVETANQQHDHNQHEEMRRHQEMETLRMQAVAWGEKEKLRQPETNNITQQLFSGISPSL